MQLSIVHPRVLATQDFTPHAARQGIPGSEETLIPLYQQRSPLVSKKPGGATDEQ